MAKIVVETYLGVRQAFNNLGDYTEFVKSNERYIRRIMVIPAYGKIENYERKQNGHYRKS